MKLTRVLLVAFTFAFLASCTNDDNENVSNLASCTNDDNENVSKGNYDNGVFILNASHHGQSLLGPDSFTPPRCGVFLSARNPSTATSC